MNASHWQGAPQTEVEFRQNHPWLWWSTLVGPILVTFCLWITLGIIGGIDFLMRITTSIALSLWLFGRFLILAGRDSEVSWSELMNFDGSLSSFQLFVLVTYLDTIVALVLAFHIGYLFRIPVIGPRAAALVEDGQFILAFQPWMRKATFIGLIAFVGFPLAATGSVGGSIFGRLLGMRRFETFLGIVIGSIIGNGLMFAFADILGQWIDKDHPVIRFGGLIVMVLIILLLERRYRILKKYHFDKNDIQRGLSK